MSYLFLFIFVPYVFSVLLFIAFKGVTLREFALYMNVTLLMITMEIPGFVEYYIEKK